MKVLVLGAGKMVEAILLGLKRTEDLSDWGIFSPGRNSARQLAAITGARFVPELDNLNPSWILIGCKPQQLSDLKKTIGNRFNEKLFLSLLAAVDEKTQLQVLEARRLIRIMPNLQVKFEQGVTLIASSSAPEELQSVKAMFQKLGTAVTLKEEELEELTLLTGSGPAFFYEFTQLLAGQFNSLDGQTREGLARQVLIGSGVAAGSESCSMQMMIDDVTSKGGVTIAVLSKWRELELGVLLQKGFKQGWERSKEIKKSILQS